MKTHFEYLEEQVPDLRSRKILDLGSGKGKFLIDALQKGAVAEGLELYQGYIDETYRRAKEAGVTVSVIKGVGESLPFQDSSFDFINMCEVIEHVEHPEKVMKEVFRVLRPGGKVYVSVPNRFGMKDQHFNLYGVNWLPRAFSDIFISIFGKHKNYTGETGHQRLREMHYYTFGSAKRLFMKIGFTVEDARIKKLRRRFSNPVLYIPMRCLYHCLRFFYFDSFHFLLTK